MNPPYAIRFVLGLMAGILAAHAGAPLLALAAGAAVLVAAGERWTRGRHEAGNTVLRAGFAIVIGLAVGAALGHRHYHVFAEDHIRSTIGDAPVTAVVDGVISSEPSTRRAGYLQWTSFRLATESVTSGGGPRSSSGELFVLASRADAALLRYGQRVRLSGKLGPTAGPQNPGEPDRRVSGAHDRIFGSLAVSETGALDVIDEAAGNPVISAILALKERMRRSLRTIVSGDAAAFLDSILLGDRAELSQEVVDDFTRTGTVHILAISGQHLSLICGLLGLVLVRIARATPRTSDLVVLGFAIVYCLMTGASAPVLRATIMIAIVFLGRLRARDAGTLNSLAVAAIAILAWDPGDLFSIGFQLSFAAIAGLELLYRPVHRRWIEALPAQGVRPSWSRWIGLRAAWIAGDAVLVSLAATLATTPLILWHFHCVVPGSVLANVVIAAPVWVVLTSGMIALLVAPLSPLCAKPFAWIASLATEALTSIVERMANLPGMYAYVPETSGAQTLLAYAALGALAWAGGRARLPRGVAAMASVVFVAALLPYPAARPAAGTAEVAILSVGRGQTVVVRTETSTVLFDCGSAKIQDPAGRQIAPFLWSRGVRRIDAIVLTTGDDEHRNAVEGILDRFAVRALHVPRGFEDTWAGGRLLERFAAAGIPVFRYDGGDRFDAHDGVAVEVLRASGEIAAGPATRESGLGGPGGSAAADAVAPGAERPPLLRVTAGGRSILLGGDTPEGQVAEILRKLKPERDIQSEVVVLPNHGARLRCVGELARRIRPTLAVASTREGGSNADTLCALEDAGVEVAETWDAGCVELTLSPEGVTARGLRRGDLGARAFASRRKAPARKKMSAPAPETPTDAATGAATPALVSPAASTAVATAVSSPPAREDHATPSTVTPMAKAAPSMDRIAATSGTRTRAPRAVTFGVDEQRAPRPRKRKEAMP